MRLKTGAIQNPSDGTIVKKSWPHYLAAALTLATAVTALACPATDTNKLDALLLLLAIITSITALTRTLPLQSVLFAAFIAAFIGSVAHGLSARTGLPFGPVSFGEASGPELFNTIPWIMPLLWIIAIFNSRGVARLILRPWRKVKNYGFLLLGLAIGLALLFDLALEPFASARHLWFWEPTKLHIAWHGASPLSFCAWTFVAAIILAVILPFLIRKQPGGRSTPDWSPLALWLGAILFFSISDAQVNMWTAVSVNLCLSVVVGVFSWRGARW